MLQFELLEISEGLIRFKLYGEIEYELVYELVYDHSEGEFSAEPYKHDYEEYFELELDNEVLVNQESYEQFVPSQRLTDAIKAAVANFHTDKNII